MSLSIYIIKALTDNYIYILRNESSTKTAVLDPTLSAPVLQFLSKRNWNLDMILNTHHHWDHVGGNIELKNRYSCTIYGSLYDKNRIPGLDKTLKEGDQIEVGSSKAHILDVPGHTLGHIVYWFKEDNIIFTGDTLFSLGCGRLFEGSPEQLSKSLSKISQLPPQTKVYCAHEYTLTNGQFAIQYEPSNTDLINRIKDAQKKIEDGHPSLPTTIELELKTNPFLRTSNPEIKHHLKMTSSQDIEIFSELRHLRDSH